MANTVVSVGHTDFGLFTWECGTERQFLLQTHASQLAEPAPSDWSKGRLGPQPSSSRAGGAPAARAPAANLRQLPSTASKLKPGTTGKNGCVSADMPSPRNKLSTSGGKEVICYLPLLWPNLPTLHSLHRAFTNMFLLNWFGLVRQGLLYLNISASGLLFTSHDCQCLPMYKHMLGFYSRLCNQYLTQLLLSKYSVFILEILDREVLLNFLCKL